MAPPKVALILCTYNMAHYLPESLDSALALKYPNLIIVIVDDGSTDNTLSIIENNYSNKVMYIRQKNQGLFAARNTGIVAVPDADYYSITDADDRLHPLKIWDEVAFLERHPHAVNCFSNIMTFDPMPGKTHDIWQGYRRPVWKGQFLIDSDAQWGIINNPIEKISRYNALTSVATIRGDILRKLKYDPSLKCSGDMDLAIRLTRVGTTGFINQIRYFHRHEGQGMTSYMRNRITVYMQIFDKVWQTADQYTAQEIFFLKKKETDFLLQAWKGIILGQVDPKLLGYIRQRLPNDISLRKNFIIHLIKWANHLGLAQVIARRKAHKFKNTYTAQTPTMNDVLSNMTPCFDSLSA